MSALFEPLENAIRDQFIPALVGREVSEAERQLVALPLQHGGLGLTDPRETAKTEYKHSTQITDKLTAKIYVPCERRSSVNSRAWLRRFDDVTRVVKTDILH